MLIGQDKFITIGKDADQRATSSERDANSMIVTEIDLQDNVCQVQG